MGVSVHTLTTAACASEIRSSGSKPCGPHVPGTSSPRCDCRKRGQPLRAHGTQFLRDARKPPGPPPAFCRDVIVSVSEVKKDWTSDLSCQAQGVRNRGAVVGDARH